MPIDRSNAGRRVRLIMSDDPATSLVTGSEGTLRFETEDEWAISWDDGSTLSMLKGLDEIEFID